MGGAGRGRRLRRARARGCAPRPTTTRPRRPSPRSRLRSATRRTRSMRPPRRAAARPAAEATTPRSGRSGAPNHQHVRGRARQHRAAAKNRPRPLRPSEPCTISASGVMSNAPQVSVPSMNANGSISKLVRSHGVNQPAFSTRLMTATMSPARLHDPLLDAAAAATIVPATRSAARDASGRCSPRSATARR